MGMGGQWKVEDRKVGGKRRKGVGCNHNWASGYGAAWAEGQGLEKPKFPGSRPHFLLTWAPSFS